MLLNCLYLISLYSSVQGVYVKSQAESIRESNVILKPQLRILGGEVVNKYQDELTYPFMTSLQKFEKHRCGGILLSNKKVLTAAHCGETPENWSVAAHIVDLNEIENYHHQVSLVDSIVRHPQYDIETNLHDISIWFLSGNGIQGLESNHIDLGHDYDESDIVRPLGEIIGWGVTERESKVASDHLNHLTLPILKPNLCSKLLKNMGGFIYNSNNHICAGYLDGKADGCQGDSGGPLFVNTTRSDGSTMFTMIGISSYGVGCAIKNSPGVYTRISHYRDFINRTGENYIVSNMKHSLYESFSRKNRQYFTPPSDRKPPPKKYNDSPPSVLRMDRNSSPKRQDDRPYSSVPKEDLDSSPSDNVDLPSIPETPTPRPDLDSSPPKTGLGGIILSIVDSVKQFIPKFDIFGLF